MKIAGKLVLATLLLLPWVSGCSSNDGFMGSPQGSSSSPTTTVLVYMNGSNLQGPSRAGENGPGFGTANLYEMLQAMQLASSPSVKVAVTTGGALNYPGSNQLVQDWANVHRYEVTATGLIDVTNTTTSSHVGAVSMDDPATLQDFLTWGIQAYPSQRRLVVLWDHGAGYKGYGSDVAHPAGGAMSLIQMQQAFQGALSATQAPPFDVVGFDACLMACDEVCNTLQSSAKLLIASQNIEPGEGWDYIPWLAQLEQEPGVDLVTLGQTICNSYVNKCIRLGNRDRATLSVLDLSRYPAYASARNQYVSDLRGSFGGSQLTTFQDLAQGILLSPEMELEGQNYPDFYYSADFRSWIKYTGQQGLAPSSGAALTQAIDQMVVYNKVGRAEEGTVVTAGNSTGDITGLSVFYPRDWKDSTSTDYLKLGSLAGLAALVQDISTWVGQQTATFATFANLSLSGGAFSGQVVDKVGIAGARTVWLTSDPSTAASGTALPFAAECQIRLDRAGSKTSVSFSLDTTAVNVVALGGASMPVVLPSGFNNSFTVPCKVNSKEAALSFNFDRDKGSYEFEGVITDQGPKATPFGSGDVVQLRQFVYQGGVFQEQNFGAPYAPGPNPKLQVQAMPAGTYYLAVWATDNIGLDFLSNQSLPITY